MRRIFRKQVIGFILLSLAALLSACSPFQEKAPEFKKSPAPDSVTILGVTVSKDQISIHGQSSLTGDVCIRTRLIAQGQGLDWWPDSRCAAVDQGSWEMQVELEQGTLKSSEEYTIQAFINSDELPAAVFPFDLGSPPPPPTAQ